MKNPDIVWAIGDGAHFASMRVPVGGKMVGLPMVFTSRADARLVMKHYPQLAGKSRICKMRNCMMPITGGAK